MKFEKSLTGVHQVPETTRHDGSEILLFDPENFPLELSRQVKNTGSSDWVYGVTFRSGVSQARISSHMHEIRLLGYTQSRVGFVQWSDEKIIQTEEVTD